MIYCFSILMMILFFSCEKENSASSVISNQSDLNLEYSINLNWDESEERLKTAVNIKWRKWTGISSFERYEIKDVSTTQDKWIADIISSEDTTYQIDFPRGTFYTICVLAHYNNEFISSDSVWFFTQPLSPITNLSVDAQTLMNMIIWEPSVDDQIDKLIIYRAEILTAHLAEAGNPVLESSMLSANGEIEEDNEIFLNGVEIGSWTKLHQGINTETTYNDSTAMDLASSHTLYYVICIQIESSEDETNIANYRYSFIVPENISVEPTLIQEESLNLSASTDLDNIIDLNWIAYANSDDFYSYEIWRSDVESTVIESLENTGQKLVEITARTQTSFEDISLIGSEKSFYYFIRVNNNYGDTLESNIVEGDTTL